MSLGQLEAVARLFGVLSEPSRLVLIQALHDRPRTVGELVEACDMKQANVSKHLAVLAQAGLVTRTPKGTQAIYEVADPLVFRLCDLVCLRRERAGESRRGRLRFAHSSRSAHGRGG